MAEPHTAPAAIVRDGRLQNTLSRPTSNRRSLWATSVVALAALVAPSIAHPDLRLVWNVSASVPLGLYRIEPGRHPIVGELAAVRPSPALARLMELSCVSYRPGRSDWRWRGYHVAHIPTFHVAR
jgi:hypothetical protein